MRGDRHGRAWRADGSRRRRPADGFRTRDFDRFLLLVDDVLADLPGSLAAAAAAAEIEVREIPPPPEPPLVDPPLASFRPGTPGGRLVLYRRPIESRAESRADLMELIRLAAGQSIARALGLSEDGLWD